MKKQYIIFSALLIVFVVVLFILTRFSRSSILSTEGYFVSQNEIKAVLFSDEENVNVKKISLKKVEYEDIFYRNLNNIYIGEDEKTYVDDDYPIYSNAGSALVNISDKSSLITSKFEKEECYLNATITDGKLYNYNDNEQASFENYYFLKLVNGEFVNLSEMKVKTYTEEYTIPVNSILRFKEHSVKFFYYGKQEGELVYKEINGIDIANGFQIGEDYFEYGNLLYKLNVISEEYAKELDVDTDKDKEIEDEKEKEIQNIPQKEYEQKYVKPTVTTTEIIPRTYSATSVLTIRDPAGVIIGGINYYFYKGDNIYLRKAFASGGKILITGFEPNTTYKVVASFKYYDENKKKIEQKFYEQTFTTESIDDLDPVTIEYENGDVYPDKIELKDVHITSSFDNDALNGLNKIKITINGEEYFFSSSLLGKLKLGQLITFTSPSTLPSRSNIHYKIQLYDSFGNEIKSKIKEGDTITSKKPPTVQVKVTDLKINYVIFESNLINDDDVNVVNYRYIIYDTNLEIIEEGMLDPSQKINEVKLTTLDTNTLYTVHIYGDYNLEDGKGNQKDVLLGSGKFTTMPLSSLGYFRLDNSISDLTDESVAIRTTIDRQATSPILVELLTSMTLKVYDENKEVVFTRDYNHDQLVQMVNDEYAEIYIDGLFSKSSYTLEYTAGVTQGKKEEIIKTIPLISKFKTYRQDAVVEITNKFVNESIIDFDARVVDVDDAIEGDLVILEVRTSSGKLVEKSELTKNEDYKRFTFNKLEPNSEYLFKYVVTAYNKGYDNSTFENDFVLLLDRIVTEEGIKGKIELKSLLRQINSKNLFDITDLARIRTEGNIANKSYDFDKNQVKFTAKNGYVNYAYYLPEGHRHYVRISFEAKYDPESQSHAPVYISNNFNRTLTYKLPDLSDEWQTYSLDLLMTTPYIGFLIDETSNVNTKTEVLFRNIEIVSRDLAIDATSNQNLSVHQSGKKFTNTLMVSGEDEMPSHRTGEVSTFGNYGDGYARITDLKTKEVFEFAYTGAAQSFIPHNNSTYRIELWGAGGGDSTNTGGQNLTIGSHGGRGAYTRGEIDLTPNDTLYIYVGGRGMYGAGKSAYGGAVGGYNGGGNAGNKNSGSGGGATDVRLVGGVWNDQQSLKSRIMVAAGGGGSDDASGTVLHAGNDGSGGAGGDIESRGTYIDGVMNTTFFATQTYGYSLGAGQNAVKNSDVAGAGGGYWGGIAQSSANGGGTGGSSYISGHLGCVASHLNFTYGNDEEYVEYSEKDKYIGQLIVNLDDTRQEIVSDDYYLRIYIEDELVDTLQYNLIEDKAINEIRNYEFRKNKKYTVALAVKIRGRFYDLETLSFDTNSEIRSIKDLDELFSINTTGRFIVLNDIDIRGVSRTIGYNFYGEVDFQGHKIYNNTNGRSSYIFHTLKNGAVLKNIVVDMYIDNPSSKTYYYGLVYSNSGTIDNVFVTLKEAISNPNYAFSLITWANYGTIKNFVINCEAQFSAYAVGGLVTWSNQGIIMNGYVYGQNINGNFENLNRSRKDIGVLAGETTTNSIIQNVYSLITVEKDASLSSEESVGNLIGYSGTGTLKNAYSVELTPENSNNLTSDPNTGTISNINANRVYYVSDKTYGGTAVRSNKISKLALYDVDFQEELLNQTGAFEVQKYVQLGYFPHVKLNDCMPNQEWIELPKVEDDDLVDITSVKELTNNGDNATLELRVNNPAQEEIVEIGMKDIGRVDIISQEDERGISKVIVNVSEPINYVSKYYVRKIVSKGSLGFQSTRNYGEFERGVEFSLYYPIKTIDDWKAMNNNRSQNYMLKADLDFGSVDASKYVITGTFTGKVHGAGHTIKNIRLDTSNGMFSTFRGKMQDLYIENYVKTNASAYGGFVYQADSGAIFDMVHIKNVRTAGTTYIGGLIGYASNVLISNCSVNGYQYINTNNRMDIRIGGLIGYAANTQGQNIFAVNVDIDATGAISTYGVGALIGGFGSGTIDSVYAQGKIVTNSAYTGGIAGYNGGKIAKAWSSVEINSTMPFTGGIIGRAASQSISNTLVVGSVESSYLGEYVGRTSGEDLTQNQENYVWDKQPFNGYISSNISFEKILTTDQLKEKDTYIDLIQFDNQFNYDDIENSLPKLNNYNTGELLPNQIDVKLVEEKFNVINVEKEARIDDADLHIEIDNPENIEIRDVKFDYLIVRNPNISTQDGVTVINARVEPIRYYDNYVLTELVYDNNGKNDTYQKRVVIEGLRFYRNLSKYEDWQAIGSDTFENYRLVADIDFTGKTNIKTNVSIGRLEGANDEMHTIKNMTIAVPSSNNFGIIKTLTKSMKNVKFENITLTGNGSGTYVNLITFNYADIDNLELKDITINTPNAPYAVPIGRHRGIDMRNVRIDHVVAKGKDHTAGLVGHSLNYSTYNIFAQNCDIYGNGNMVGGIFAEKDYANPSTNFQVSAENMTVEGLSNVGGVFGYGGADYSYIKDSTVKGIKTTATDKYYVGGFAGRLSHRYAVEVNVSNVDVIGNGQSRIGGLAGWAYDINKATIDNVRVKSVGNAGKNGLHTGGVQGYHDGYTLYRITITNSSVTSGSEGTGGVFGYDSGGSSYYTYVYNVSVTGTTRVGGFAGTNKVKRTYYAIVNAKVSGTEYVGGAYGAVDSIDDSNSSYSGISHSMILANTSVTGETNVAGYAGYASRQITDAFYYKTLLAVQVIGTNTDAKVGLITPYDSIFIEKVPRFVAYENSTINGEPVKNISSLNPLTTSQYLTAAKLKTKTTYTTEPLGLSTTYFTTTPVDSGNYPKLTASYSYGTMPDIKLPTSNVQFEITGTTRYGVHELPKYKIYPSGVDTINIDFECIDERTMMTIVSGNKTINNQRINRRTFTFQYNYKDNITITLSDGVNRDVKIINSEELRNLVSTYDDKYAYIYEGTLKGNIKEYANAIHIYNNYLLTDNLTIYDLSTNKVYSDYKEIEFTLLNETKPLYEFKYGQSSIKTYGTYSIINSYEGTTIYENVIYIKNNKVEIIDQNLERNIYGIIIDDYNDKEVATVLLKNHKIFNIKDKILTPKEFNTDKIIYMSNNMNTDSGYVVVMYENGKVVVFDYRTGKEVTNEKMTKKISFVEYAQDHIEEYTGLGVIDEEHNNYQDAIELRQNLKQNNIVKDEGGNYVLEEKKQNNNNNGNSGSDNNSNEGNESNPSKTNYVTFYNNVSNSYEVIDVYKVLEENDPVSESDKINGTPDLITFFSTNKETKSNTSINIIYIFGLIVFGILVFFLLWLKNVKLVIKEKKR